MQQLANIFRSHILRSTCLIVTMSPQGNDLGAFQETDASVLEVSQCSADVFRAVLAHIYTGRSAPSLADVWDLTAVAEFYMLSGLQASIQSVCIRCHHGRLHCRVPHIPQSAGCNWLAPCPWFSLYMSKASVEAVRHMNEGKRKLAEEGLQSGLGHVRSEHELGPRLLHPGLNKLSLPMTSAPLAAVCR